MAFFDLLNACKSYYNQKQIKFNKLIKNIFLFFYKKPLETGLFILVMARFQRGYFFKMWSKTKTSHYKFSRFLNFVSKIIMS
ncbi:hypothetical protein EBR43_01675 [bacterium]|nr:hypothetical protein [bacterium]NBX71685.1 hypothetical protein [bacterium]